MCARTTLKDTLTQGESRRALRAAASRAGKAGEGDADSDPARRPVDPSFAKGFENTFSDGYPIHLTAEVRRPALQRRLAPGGRCPP